jgi:hypothetical protein
MISILSKIIKAAKRGLILCLVAISLTIIPFFGMMVGLPIMWVGSGLVIFGIAVNEELSFLEKAGSCTVALCLSVYILLTVFELI